LLVAEQINRCFEQRDQLRVEHRAADGGAARQHHRGLREVNRISEGPGRRCGREHGVARPPRRCRC